MKRRLTKAVQVAGVLVWPIALVGLRVWSRISRQQRARVVIWNEYGEVLLVKGVIGHRQWSLPGGGIDRDEDPRDAAVREVREELGLQLPGGALREVVFVARTDKDGYEYDAWIFATSILKEQFDTAHSNIFEIRDAQWFSVDAFPSDVSDVTRALVLRAQA